MKKSIKSIYALAFCLLFLASACKKNDLSLVKDTLEETTIQSAQAPASGSSAALSAQPNALLDISQTLYNQLVSGRNINTKKVTGNRFVATSVLNTPFDVLGAVDPCIGAWNLFLAYRQANLASFRAWANYHCKPYIDCWCHPNPTVCNLCVTFQVNPTLPCFEAAVYVSPIKIFKSEVVIQTL